MKIYAKRVLSMVLVVTMLIVSSVCTFGDAQAKNVIDGSGKMKVYLSREGVKEKKVYSVSQMRAEFKKNMKKAEAIQMTMEDFRNLNENDVMECIDNGCVVYVEEPSISEIKNSEFIKEHCSGVEHVQVDGFTVEGVWLQNNGGECAIGFKGVKYCDSVQAEILDINQDTDIDLKDLVEDVKNQNLEESYGTFREISKKEKKSTLHLQFPTGYTQQRNVSVNCRNNGKVLGIAKIVQYIYAGRRKGGKAVDYAVSSFTVSPKKGYAVSARSGFTAQMSTGKDYNDILDESYINSDSANSSYSISASSSDVGVSYTNSYSTSGMNVINSFAEEDKRKWKCKPQSIVYEQARKIEPSIAVLNKKTSQVSTKFTSELPQIGFVGTILEWKLQDKAISITDYYFSK